MRMLLIAIVMVFLLALGLVMAALMVVILGSMAQEGIKHLMRDE